MLVSIHLIPYCSVRRLAGEEGEITTLGDKARASQLPDLPDERLGQSNRHWYFLAEIVDVDLTYLYMETSDVDGRKVPLLFYTNGRGSELECTEIQSGYTVAILYAQRHMFDVPEIHHEDPARVKVQLPKTIQFAPRRMLI